MTALHATPPPTADPVVFVGAALSRQLAEPTVATATDPSTHQPAAICEQLWETIMALIVALHPVDRAPYYDVCEAWAMHASAAATDRALASDWRAELGQRLAELIVSLDTRDPDASLADAIRLHARELVWRLERAGQQRLPLDDAPIPCAEDFYP